MMNINEVKTRMLLDQVPVRSLSANFFLSWGKREKNHLVFKIYLYSSAGVDHKKTPCAIGDGLALEFKNTYYTNIEAGYNDFMTLYEKRYA